MPHRIGGYQVAHKWLKDRTGRTLTFKDLEHYGGVLGTMAETIRTQSTTSSSNGVIVKTSI